MQPKECSPIWAGSALTFMPPGATIAEKNRIPYLGCGIRPGEHPQAGLPLSLSRHFGSRRKLPEKPIDLLNGSLPDNQRPKKVALFLEKDRLGTGNRRLLGILRKGSRL